MISKLSEYTFHADGLTDIGLKRSSNQDEVILVPDYGFFAVSDGMGGLPEGGEASQLLAYNLPAIMKDCAAALGRSRSPKQAAKLLNREIQSISDYIYRMKNTDKYKVAGATLSGVWLIGKHAVFVNLGDSRGYLLPRYKKSILQITTDHNLAARLIAQGKLTPRQAQNHHSSSMLLRFAGMDSPATPETFICEIKPGDRILLCSDGLHGMVDENFYPQILRTSSAPLRICKNLTNQANAAGGRDNIAVVCILIS